MNSVKGRLLNDWAQVLAWNIIRCVIVEECAGEIIVWLLRRITRDIGRRNDRRDRGPGGDVLESSFNTSLNA
jgi:hypothetical protein